LGISLGSGRTIRTQLTLLLSGTPRADITVIGSAPSARVFADRKDRDPQMTSTWWWR
jgi:hypothetical protein